MNSNFMGFLTFTVFLMLAISVYQDLKRKRQEWNRYDENLKRKGHEPKLDYHMDIKDHRKANWHKGFQMALGTVLFFLLMEYANEFGWLDGGGILEPDPPSNPNG
jgi:hypothetical protein